MVAVGFVSATLISSIFCARTIFLYQHYHGEFHLEGIMPGMNGQFDL